MIKFEMNATGAVLAAAVAGVVVALAGIGVYSLARPTGTPPVAALVSRSTPPIAANSHLPVTSEEPAPTEPHGSRKQVLDRLTDPSTAQFRNTFYGPVVDGERAWCGEVNAKNQMGGYVGFERFIASPKLALIDTRDGREASVFWAAICEKAKPTAVRVNSVPETPPGTKAPVLTAAETGKRVYEANCAMCHTAGVAGALKFGDKAAWALRLSAGMDAIYSIALKGKGAMPPKGTYGGPDADVIAATDYMVSAVK
ncbi:hypothetical protein CJO81_06990 [Ralstonia solanacearum]|uniref:c-type cytochrome n=1 Tax=Ralstonia pseudosolanacearum TaxID=1310165 RepID=UPI000E5762DB|nr:c-type cytochrome [Ralstonia pseudosolanacearum]AXW00533.1 hypothetical protein CJO81_06990 [Ralstonia solanacearum]AXW28024.1 hypothetical protein CJO87_06990 [Ralstonia solanacearum]NJZ67451.1 cytochrome c5 family protein [Ralstonia solanacearum]NJZ76798.1 cytochrome c5 family protein [Ralstonia solanacearum]NJZ81299.1 cytochrome c5 family protein [Ralstonia solanacearum]